MKTKLNPHIWLVILFCFIIIFSKILITGDIFYFLHPKMLPYVFFTLFMFIILFIERLIKLFQSSSKMQPIKWSVLVFVIPIILSFNKPSAMTGDVLTNRSINLGIQKESLVDKLNSNASSVAPTATDQITNDDDLEIKINSDLQNQITGKDDSTEFLDKIFRLQSSIDDVIGEEMTIKGFVFRDDTLSENQLVVARLYVSCCVADTGVLGVLVESEDAMLYVNESWIEVTGTVDTMPYHDEVFDLDYDIPILRHAQIVETKPLNSMYIFE